MASLDINMAYQHLLHRLASSFICALQRNDNITAATPGYAISPVIYQASSGVRRHDHHLETLRRRHGGIFIAIGLERHDMHY